MDDSTDTRRLVTHKPWSEEELLSLLRADGMLLPPAQIHLANVKPERPHPALADGVLEVTWRQRKQCYVFEYKASSSPQAVEQAVVQVRRHGVESDLPPLVIVPFLSEEHLIALEKEGVSGVDLSGNGVITAHDFTIWRSGQPNRYKDTRPIRNPFHGDSSIFARCFLLRDHFPTLAALGRFAQERTFSAYPAFRSKALTQGTASKVIQTLADELAVRRVGTGLELQDQKRLLMLLRKGYRKTDPPKVIGTSQLSSEKIWEILREERACGTLRAVTTGLSSAGHYKALSGVGRLALYVSDINKAATKLQIRAGRAFANIELVEDRKSVAYFDAREEGDKLWASPIQTWVELITGGPREQEAAEDLERMLLAKHGEHD